MCHGGEAINLQLFCMKQLQQLHGYFLYTLSVCHWKPKRSGHEVCLTWFISLCRKGMQNVVIHSNTNALKPVRSNPSVP